jgi:hypothetical protein
MSRSRTYPLKSRTACSWVRGYEDGFRRHDVSVGRRISIFITLRQTSLIESLKQSVFQVQLGSFDPHVLINFQINNSGE